jgi:hypothetical protein
MTPTKQATGLLSPTDWANAVGQHLATQSRHNNNKVTAEFTVTPNARPGCHTICIYITIPPLCLRLLNQSKQYHASEIKCGRCMEQPI